MWPFDLFKKKSTKLFSESLWVVEVDANGITATDQTGKTMSISFADLAGVAVETNDSGPWGADVWWLLFDGAGKLGCAFPQGASGEQDALDRLMALPEFDNERMIEAMASTNNAVFRVWPRSGPSDAQK